MRALVQLVRVNALLFLREPAALFFTLVFPMLLLVVFGVIFGNEPGQFGPPGIGYLDVQVPALAGLIIGTTGLIGIPTGTATMRELGVFRRYRATPVRPTLILASDIIVNLGLALVGLTLLVALGRALFGLRVAGSWPIVLAGFAFAACAFFALGYLIASLSPTARVAQTVGMGLFFPMMFVSGAAFPRQMMPETVRQVADVLPLTHVVSFLQGLWAGRSWLAFPTELAWLTGLLVVGTAVSARFFQWE